MLTVKRPHASDSEAAFIARYLLPLGVVPDGFGNLTLRIGDNPHLLWSSHTDTCHRRPGAQRIVFDGTYVTVDEPQVSNCLGADCTAGVWLMTEMIKARIPGLYVFHRGEERGGLGSAWIAKQTPNLLAGMRAAVAFDRRGTQSIITHQRGARSCSDTFAASLARALHLDHRLDPTGTFTDTANYVDLIGECTNLSVGYEHEHTEQETLNVAYLLQLRDAMLAADLDHLAFARKPGECEPDLDEGWSSPTRAQPRYGQSRDLYELVHDYPAAVADFLEHHGIGAQELEPWIAQDYPF
jgi:hypothetical protein